MTISKSSAQQGASISKSAANAFINFLNKSVSPFHAVAACEELLTKAGFIELREDLSFKLKPLDKCYIKKNESTIFAFAVGGAYTPATGGFSMVAAHTDSPCLRLKPISKKVSEQYLQVGVIPYGGGLWRTWFDRDLSLAGQVIYTEAAAEAGSNEKTSGTGGSATETFWQDSPGRSQHSKLRHCLVNIGRPVLQLPNLAIHLETEDQRTKFAINTEAHLRPILATANNRHQKSGEQLEKLAGEKCSPTDGKSVSDKEAEDAGSAANTATFMFEDPGSNTIDEKMCTAMSNVLKDHHESLLKVIAAEAGCPPERIVDLDLYLYDTQPAALTGLYEEFIAGARLDNLIGTYTAIVALIESLKLAPSASGGGDATTVSKLDTCPNIRLVACYDNEEVGSGSAQGACTAFTERLLRRIVYSYQQQQQLDGSPAPETDAFDCAIGRSLLLSVDQAHAVHPNYAHKHEDVHKPSLQGGLVVKINPSQRYATSPLGHSIIKLIADAESIPLQKMAPRTDLHCGTTIGPILATKLGIQTVDMGTPQLAMHSIRELGSASCIHQAVQLYTAFFNRLPGVLANIQQVKK